MKQKFFAILGIAIVLVAAAGLARLDRERATGEALAELPGMPGIYGYQLTEKQQGGAPLEDVYRVPLPLRGARWWTVDSNAGDSAQREAYLAGITEGDRVKLVEGLQDKVVVAETWGTADRLLESGDSACSHRALSWDARSLWIVHPDARVVPVNIFEGWERWYEDPSYLNVSEIGLVTFSPDERFVSFTVDFAAGCHRLRHDFLVDTATGENLLPRQDMYLDEVAWEADSSAATIQTIASEFDGGGEYAAYRFDATSRTLEKVSE
jgi:hypothetical protein